MKGYWTKSVGESCSQTRSVYQAVQEFVVHKLRPHILERVQVFLSIEGSQLVSCPPATLNVENWWNPDPMSPLQKRDKEALPSFDFLQPLVTPWYIQ